MHRTIQIVTNIYFRLHAHYSNAHTSLMFLSKPFVVAKQTGLTTFVLFY